MTTKNLESFLDKGSVAQLGEQMAGSHPVVGSIPTVIHQLCAFGQNVRASRRRARNLEVRVQIP